MFSNFVQLGHGANGATSATSLSAAQLSTAELPSSGPKPALLWLPQSYLPYSSEPHSPAIPILQPESLSTILSATIFVYPTIRIFRYTSRWGCCRWSCSYRSRGCCVFTSCQLSSRPISKCSSSPTSQPSSRPIPRSSASTYSSCCSSTSIFSQCYTRWIPPSEPNYWTIYPATPQTALCP
jgi:hypothetical protein